MKKKLRQFALTVSSVIILFTIGLLVQEIYVLNKENKALTSEINSQNEETRSKDYKIDSLNNVVASLEIIQRITATMYNPTVEQCDDDPHITADGSFINVERASEHRWIAVSRDLLHYNGGPFNYGDEVIIITKEGILGLYEVRDTMNERWSGRIDVLETFGTKHYKYDDITLLKI